MGFVVPGAPEGSTGRWFCSVFCLSFRSPGSNMRPWFTRRVTYQLHHGCFYNFATFARCAELSNAYILFAITAAGVVPCGGPKKSPRTSSIVQILFLFRSYEIS